MDATLNQRFINVDPCYLPSAALDDFAVYLRQGGRFSLEVWWERYKDDYEALPKPSEWPCTADRMCMASHHQESCPIRVAELIKGKK